jgi:hypothetical protein
MPVDSQLAGVGHYGLAAVFSTPGSKRPAIENLSTFGPAGVLFSPSTATGDCTRHWLMPIHDFRTKNGLPAKSA